MSRHKRTRTRYLATACLLLLAVTSPLVLETIRPGTGRALIEGLAALHDWNGLAGAVTLVVLQAAIAGTGFVPASLVGVAAGALFGPMVGFLLASAGTMTGALLSFAFARRILRPHAVGRLRRLDDCLCLDGWRLVCLLRLSAVMPFAPTSLVLGASAVPLTDYVLGTLAATPALFGYVVLGALGASSFWPAGHGGTDQLRLGLMIIGGLATIVLMLRLPRLIARCERQLGRADLTA